MHQRAVFAGECFWEMLLGDAGLDPQASRRCLDSRRLNWRRHFERDLPQPWYSCGGDRNRLRYSGDELPTHPGVFLPNPDGRRLLLRDLPGCTNTVEFCR
jgi:hypothetical protein